MRNRFAIVSAALSVVSIPLAASAQDIKVGGALEVNYTYNFNKPSTAMNGAPGAPYYFNAKDAQFALNYAELHVYKDATDKSPSGFSLRLIDGEAATGIGLGMAGVAANNKLFYEAYGRTITAVGSKPLTVDAGIFPTFVGYETIPMGTGSFLSRSFHCGQFQPFFHAGVRASVPLDAKTTLLGVLVNRYSGVDANGNKTPGVGVQLARVFSPEASIYVNAFTARTTLAGAERPESIFNVVYTQTVNKTFSWAVDASAVSGKKAGDNNYTAAAATLYGFLGLGNGDVLALRAEQLTENSAGGLLLPTTSTGGKPKLGSLTASYEFKRGAKPGARTLVELRFDTANTAVFPTDVSAKKNSTTLSLVQAFTF